MTMKCINCEHLLAITGEVLPEEQRRELRDSSPHSFVWLICSEAVERFYHSEPLIYEQLLKDRRCWSYVRFPHTAKRAWLKMATLSGLIVIICTSTIVYLFV